MKALQTTPRSAFRRGFIDGIASLFDIFGVLTPPRRSRTPEDDVRNLNRDLQRISSDFQVVLSRIDGNVNK